MSYTSLSDSQFSRQITLRDAYRIMERFCAGYLERGDLEVSHFLYAYAGEVVSGQTTDPAAADDFLQAAQEILGSLPTGSGTRAGA